MNKKNNNNPNIFNFIPKKYGQYILRKTSEYQKKYGFKSGTGEHATWNNEADAFKHTFMQAQLALFTGKHAAKFFGDFHEIQGNLFQGQDKGENNMDNWNNAQGREIAKELIHEYGIKVTAAFNPDVCDLIAEKVHQRMKAGKLITHPNDPRRYVPKNKNGITTGQAAPIINSVKSTPITQPTVKSDKPQTPSQNFSDMIRQKYKNQQNKSNEKFRQIFSRHSSSYNTENGHWVTMNGAHVFIEDK